MAKVRHRATALNRRPLRRRLSSWKWHRLRHCADVRCWHEADIKLRPLFGRYGVESGHNRLVMSISAFDPKRTSSQPLRQRPSDRPLDT
jgi:hypothetical protein